MTVLWTVRAATDRAAEKSRNPLGFSDAAVRPIPAFKAQGEAKGADGTYSDVGDK